MDPGILVWYQKWMTEVTGIWKKYIFVKTTFFSLGFLAKKVKSGKWKIIYHPWDKSLNQLNINLLQKNIFTRIIIGNTAFSNICMVQDLF